MPRFRSRSIVGTATKSFEPMPRRIRWIIKRNAGFRPVAANTAECSAARHRSGGSPLRSSSCGSTFSISACPHIYCWTWRYDYDTDKSLSLAGHICANLSPRAKKGGHKCANLPQPAKRRVRCLPLPKQIKNAVFRLERRRGNYDFLFNSVPMQNSYSSETVRYGFWYRFFHRWMRYTFAAPGVKYTGFRRSPARRPQMSAIFPAPRFPGG